MVSAGTPASTGRADATRCASSTSAGGVVSRFEVEHTRALACASSVRRLQGRRRAWPSSDPTARSSTPCSGRASRSCVIASRHVKALRTRHGLAGNKDDRIGRATSSPTPCAPTAIGCGRSSPDAPATRRAARDGAGPQGPRATRVALVQQLEAHLALVFPGAVDLFADLASDIARRFLLRFPSAERAAWLSPRRLDALARRPGLLRPAHRRRSCTPGSTAAPAGLTGDAAERHGRRDPRLRPGHRRRSATRSPPSTPASSSSSCPIPTATMFTQPAPLGAGAGSRPAGRDRRLPGAVPDARVAGLPRRRRRRRRASRASTAP